MGTAKRIRLGTIAALMAATLGMVGCGSSDSPGGTTGGGSTGGGTTGGTTGGSSGGTTGGSTGGTTGGIVGGTGNVYVSFDGGGEIGTTDTYAGDLSSRIATFNTGLNEGIVDNSGTLQGVGVVGGIATLRQFTNFANRGNTAYDPNQDREFQFNEIIAPRGIDFAGLTRNSAVVADAPPSGANDDPATLPSVHLLSSVLGLAPRPVILHTVSVAAAGGRTWDVAYDSPRDRLFAAMTNGTVAVYDAFGGRSLLASLGGPAVTPSRLITPGMVANGVSASISTNLHGIFYNPGTDQLIVSDVADAANASDGSIYVFNGANAANNVATGTNGVPIVQPAAVIRGSNTRLGNPVDLTLRGDGSLYVAEKLNGGGQILVFNGILSSTGGNLAPNRSVTTASLGSVGGPESIANAN
ncbi:hypothetical protein [Nevskia sp.]|uniref:hypothetical protein n=1 Tax=Nevskia sp. TaxID=1929292 RepID=UPI0025E0B372|nr:hypothetical protein [Nevskia sp.]